MKRNLLLILFVSSLSFLFAQDCSDLFISEYVEGSHNNKALEIYNPTDNAIDLSDYHMSRYSNGGFSPNYIGLAPGGILEAHSVLVVVLDKQNPNGTGLDTIVFDELRALADIFLCPVYDDNKMMYFNGNDAVTLEKISTSEILDIIGKIGEDPGDGWTDIDPYFIDLGEWWRLWTRDQTLIRKPEIKEGVHLNPDVFNATLEWDSLPKNTFDSLRSHTCECGNAGTSNITNFQVENKIYFFPNPVINGEFKIRSNKIFESIEIYNSLGNIVHKQKNDIPKASIDINSSNYNKGLYIVRINFTNGYTQTKKLIIK
ncbi:MAG: T9SS type A sorting domain-containing protein [Bacteroidetes bacterium]|jgi:hypothetical protein|nr:T9SS type A sorting domain-containing protein [Bacteroidota bacterium]MBT6687147.1 T9SS type A sorting domain-containing protein [Bacteroidota bacterium]MBT7144920.1 T9SS type A sorting domain-containing protein [Bacteroidota bacterium]MBT7492161.1 T9SS type A sorting domain-containing protein [Bacteroidota bacterium]